MENCEIITNIGSLKFQFFLDTLSEKMMPKFVEWHKMNDSMRPPVRLETATQMTIESEKLTMQEPIKKYSTLIPE